MHQPLRPILFGDKEAAMRGLQLSREPTRVVREIRDRHRALAAETGMFASFVIVEACTDLLRARGAE